MTMTDQNTDTNHAYFPNEFTKRCTEAYGESECKVIIRIEREAGELFKAVSNAKFSEISQETKLLLKNR